MTVKRCARVSMMFWLVLPALLVVGLGFNVPLLGVVYQSLIDRSASFSTAAYTMLIDAKVYAKVMGNTFWIAVISTVCCVVMGYPLAYWLRGLSRRWQMVGLAAIVIPFWISILVRTYAWIVIMGNAGMINRALLDWGWIASPIPFLYNELGVIIGTVNVLLPFLVLPLFAAMLKIDDRLLQAARTLGASERAVFWRVFFPLSVPALSAGAVLVFILTLGFYITPAILGGGRVPMVANMLDLLINHMPNWSLASAISMLLLLLTMVLFVFYLKLNRQGTRA